MKRLILAAFAALMLVGCDAETRDRTESYIMPKELADKSCKVYRMESDGRAKTLYVLYCPNAQTTTSYHENKQDHSTTTIDGGVDYGYN